MVKARDVKNLLNLRVQRAIRGKRLTDAQLAELIANEFINLTSTMPKVA